MRGHHPHKTVLVIRDPQDTTTVKDEGQEETPKAPKAGAEMLKSKAIG